MANKTIGLDCDGLIYDFVGAAAEWSGFTKEKAIDFDIFSAWGAPGLWDAFDEFAQRPGFCYGLKLEDDAKSFVRGLSRIGDVV